MLTKINGSSYVGLIGHGIKNLDKYRDDINDLNVFPVPDGDTGTNMVMTLKYGYEAMKDKAGSLGELSGLFASSAVFGARGNSGVIVSQFFKGLAEGLKGKNEADAAHLSAALKSGAKYAYASVASPVEGTILTVVKDASNALEKALPLSSIDEAIDVFLNEAKSSLEKTPELLPILKKANVVDSGGAGIVYFFEGMKKYLAGEEIVVEQKSEASQFIDLTKFNKDTNFEYGYCTEGLIQLKIEPSNFNLEDFKRELSKLGNSIVTTIEGDKVKLHVHSKLPGKVMHYCQRFGEFLTIKIENMTVQNIQKIEEAKQAQKFLFSRERPISSFAVVAVATNPDMQRKFFDMGADVVILSDIAPSSQDFMDAFDCIKAKKILVFPNSSNSILASMQAASFYKKAKVTVLNSRSLAECYAVLSVMDFEGSVDEAVTLTNDTISNMYELAIYHATKNIKYGSRAISANEFFSLAKDKIIEVSTTLEKVTLDTVKRVLDRQEYAVITLFYGKDIAEEFVEYIIEKIDELDLGVEVAAVPTMETLYSFTMTFE